MRTSCLVLGLLAGLTPPLAADEVKPSQTQSYQVPYRLSETKHVLVRAKINGKGPFNFLIDTGAPALYVATAVGKKLGVQAGRDGWGTFDRFEIEGGVVLTKVKGRIEDPFQLEGMNGLGLAGAEIHGIIGYTVLARFRLEFDFTRDKMTWTRLDFNPPLPEALGVQSAPGGLNAVAGIMKTVGGLLGKQAEPEWAPRGFLGVELEERDGGVRVKSVLENSPAAEAGLKPGDRLDRFRDKPVKSLADVHKLAAKLTRGETVELAVTRDGAGQTVRVRTGRGL